MLQTKQLSLREQLMTIQEQLNKHEQVNVSIVESIDDINPVDFFASFDRQELVRTFWKDPKEGTFFIGVGQLETFESKGKQRFDSMKEQWNHFISNISIPNEAPKGTGPMLMGGFSFNEKISSDKWSSFEPGLMVLPEMMLSVFNENSYMTYNVTVSQNTDLDQLVNRLKNWEQGVSSAAENKTDLVSTNSLDYRNWNQLIEQAVASIKSGELGKVVLARELEATFEQVIPINSVLERMVNQQKDSFIYVFDQGEEVFVSATPERLVRVDGDELLSTCLAGTISRGETLEEDEALASSLLNDEKNRNEHQYVVNMIKEAVEPLTDSVDIPEKPVIYPLRALQHLYTPVTAKLKHSNSIFDLIKKLHPTPALGGEPRNEAMRFIKHYEPFERGWYAAPIGWVDHQGNGEFAVAIRSALVQKDQATLFAGCGIVEESDPQEEYEETKLKFTPMLEALGGISQ
ncbi:isochorismate synthase [Aquisalibacillus elongatus]|uniref:Isochorismate synthase MenF n=1 Tax=Aquisalibacillus elongatus TaxID=485577 RepID=A0A3N5AYZ2_9BACI|nr:isochorismate synthase [Aquisalibacillus elongatus]RPF50284.1 isochorismate synthase [Aquisalibacillus elongatus]